MKKITNSLFAGALCMPLCVVAADDERAAVREKEANTEEVTILGSRIDESLGLKTEARTGSRLDIQVFELPASVSVVSQSTIQLRGARTALEAIEAAVGMSGGVSVGSIPNYATRGFTGNDLTVMRDGIRQNTNSQSSRPLDSFLFERVEVLKGPASLLYGEGAIGGAVNYVSKLPSDTPSADIYASQGSWNARRFGAGFSGPLGEQFAFRVDASLNESDGYVERSDARYRAVAASLNWQVSDATTLMLGGTFLQDNVQSYYGTPVVYDAVINVDGQQVVAKARGSTDRLVNARIEPATRRLNYNNLDNYSRTENSFWRLVLETRFNEHWSLRNESYAATQLMHWGNTESTVWNPVTQLVDRSSYFLILRDDLQLGNRLDLTWTHELAGRPNQLLFGALYDDNNQDRNSGQSYTTTPTPASVPLTGFDPGYAPQATESKTLNIKTRTTAVYIEDVFEPLDSLKLVGGLRYEQIDIDRISYTSELPFSKTYRPTTGRLGLTYSITPALNLYASYSRAAQPVSQLVSLTASQLDFSLQKGRQYEIGGKAQWLSGRLETTLALFDIEKNDLLTSEWVDGEQIQSQIGAQVSQGTELSFAGRFAHGWRVDANFAWTWIAEYREFSENVGSSVISRDGNTPANVPKVVAGLFVAKSFGSVQASAGMRYVGERQANSNNGIQLDAYTVVDASVGYQWQQFTATVQGRNLTDRQYAEWASGSGLMQRLADPRSVELSLRYRY